MRYLLDSDTCITHLRSGGTHPISLRLLATPVTDIAIATIVEAELLFGALRSAQVARNLAEVGAFCASLTVLPFDRRVVEEHARLRAELATRGTPIGPYDAIIAATALAHHLTLVSHNTREFGRVQGLRLDDWQTP